jgi:hypothetical protein
MPLVNLAERQMKTSYGLRTRPHFDIVGWKTPGDDAKAVSAKPTPQLPGPPTSETPPVPASTAAPAARTAPPRAAPAAATPTQAPSDTRKPKPKAPVNLTTETLASMADVKPVTSAEVLNDEIPSW